MQESPLASFFRILVPPIVGLSIIVGAAGLALILIFYEVRAFTALSIIGKKQVEKSISLNMISEENENSMRGLVTNFYNAWDKQDRILLFSYFTPASTGIQKLEYAWLNQISGDTYEVFNNIQLSSPYIKNIHKLKDGTFSVVVYDEVKAIATKNSGTTVNGRTVKFIMIHNPSEGWFIQKFSLLEEPRGLSYTPSDKYSAFPTLENARISVK